MPVVLAYAHGLQGNPSLAAWQSVVRVASRFHHATRTDGLSVQTADGLSEPRDSTGTRPGVPQNSGRRQTGNRCDGRAASQTGEIHCCFRPR